MCAIVNSQCLKYLGCITLVRWKKADVENKRTRTYFREINLVQHWHGHGDHGHWHLSKVSEGKVLCNLSHLLKKAHTFSHLQGNPLQKERILPNVKKDM